MAKEPTKRPPEHKALVDSILDEQIDAERLVEEVQRATDGIAAQLTALARKLVELGKKRQISAERAKELWVEAWKLLHLEEFAKHAEKVVEHVDKHLDRQVEETRKLGRPLREVSAIRSADVKARENERAALAEDKPKK